ncbi:hypothetical protein Tco_1291845 [Tanacetum coccineum]
MGVSPHISALRRWHFDFEIRSIGMKQLGSAIRINFGDCERSGPTGLELSEENLQSGITNSHKLDHEASLSSLSVKAFEIARSLLNRSCMLKEP